MTSTCDCLPQVGEDRDDVTGTVDDQTEDMEEDGDQDDTEIKVCLYSRPYEPLREKTCLRSFQPGST